MQGGALDQGHGLEPGFPPPLSRATSGGRSPRGLRAALGGRRLAGDQRRAPGTLGARAPWPQITGARAPGRPGAACSLERDHSRASGPGAGEGRPRAGGASRRVPTGRSGLREGSSRPSRGVSSAGGNVARGAEGSPPEREARAERSQEGPDRRAPGVGTREPPRADPSGGRAEGGLF